MTSKKTNPDQTSEADYTAEEMLEPIAELGNDLVSKRKQTRNQAVRYVLWGLISVVVNFLTFYVMNGVLHVEYQVANATAWVLSVQVAFWVDRLLVFNHHSPHPFREMGKFYATRIMTYLIETLVLWLGISLVGLPAVATKLLGQACALIGNFFLSKLFVFRSKV
ncbi:GtrA family protein [Lactiplantibacillus modestisalitolerans]|uniref:GtrA family protein n=1 Tax=Lactiplantibacillus modestisalitolerans TaxID=1457219 RepID=A0ABV5WRU0_9LACO|nr:GtrA family protein [Lactiplantibacillus modestisalitolerans]